MRFNQDTSLESRSPHLALAKKYWRQSIEPGDGVIDATCGNGQDTLFLAQMPTSIVFAIDIQPSALENTQKLLDQELRETEKKKVHVLLLSHEKIDVLRPPFPPRLIIYNLGYLPGGDKTITTQAQTTLLSIKRALALLAHPGFLSIMCYPGHPEGEKEEQEILHFTQSLPSHTWNVCHHRWINRPKFPSLFWIAKR